MRIVAVDNEFFGGNTGVTGLMTAADLQRVLAIEPEGHRYLLPDVCLSDDGRFLDGRTIADLPRPVEVVATDGMALRRRALEPAMSELPVVAIVGRPNVGKSTLFNRILGEQAAIVEDRPGITRDRKELEAEWLGRPFRVIDTGGWKPSGSDLDVKVSRQVEAAVLNADVVMFVVDASVGMTDEDEAIADWLRRGSRPVLVVANKADNDRRENERWEFLALGLGEPYPISALHGRRAGDLLDVVVELLPPPTVDVADAPAGDLATGPQDAPWTPDEPRPPRVAIVGRPNVGKSTLFNRLVGEDRSVVHDLPGTTRDAIDTLVETEDGPIVFVDTAGMRRRSRIDDSAEYYSLVRALRAIDDADIALLLIDATEGVTGQDQRLAERVDAAGCPIVILLNKWELINDPDERRAVLGELSAQAGLRRGGTGPADLGAHRQGGPPVATGVAGRHHAIPPSGADTRCEPCPGRGPAAPAGPRRCQSALCRAGCQ